jgi:hypothetical protein
MPNGIYKITEDFKKELSDYTGATYVVTVAYPIVLKSFKI